MGIDDEETTTTQLDTHANMVVLGSQATVFGQSGRRCDVRPFSSDCSKLESVPIVDAAMAYDCPYSMKTFILTVRNALHVPSMRQRVELGWLRTRMVLGRPPNFPPRTSSGHICNFYNTCFIFK